MKGWPAAARRRRRTLVAGLAMLACLALPALPAGMPADLAGQARRDIDAVLAGPDFSHQETHTRLVRRDPSRETPSTLPAWLALAMRLGHWLSSLGSVLLWLAAGLLVLALVVWRQLWWPALLRGATRAKAVPTPQAELALQPLARLPDDPAGAAAAAWAEGRPQLALSLLYRAALGCLATRHGLRIAEGATEGETLRLLDQVRPSARAAFARLVQAWLALAYGDQLPADFAALLEAYRQLATEAP